MAKFRGIIGYASTNVETAPGVYGEVVTERTHTCDVLRDTRSWERSEHLNDDVTINNRFSVVADAFAFENLSGMRYIKWMGSLWEIKSIEVQRPRLILTVGGIYNATPT